MAKEYKLEEELYLAVVDNNIKKVKSIFTQNNDIDINIVTNTQQTMLSSACGKSNIEIVKILLENGANIEKGQRIYILSDACSSDNV